ncbi:MAG: hypothetical protein RPU40_06525 [Candidatus Sedimenticola sp. (ex Thyasira tokunagai)]
MNFFKHLTSWLLLLTLLMVGGMANAKVASGVQNLPGGLHQAETTANALWYQAKIDFSYDDASGSPVATKSVGKEIGILRDAAKGKGNFGLGSGSRAEADKLGRAWVGDGYKVASDGKTLVGKDGLRQYRPPSYKGRLGKTQANFEQKFPGQKTKGWQSNGHLDITD